MANIEDVRRTVEEFLKKTLNVQDVKVIKISKVEDGWDAKTEVYEESSFIKSLGLPTRVKDRNIYSVKLDHNLEIESYEREGEAKLTE